MNGGVPYIFENQKISQAVHHDEFKQGKQQFEISGQGQTVMLGEYEESRHMVRPNVNNEGLATEMVKVKKTKGSRNKPSQS